jgi:cyclopropane fatty-acyl-phospholipid synthase-like methyltransferase
MESETIHVESQYGQSFFKEIADTSFRSAQVVIPFLMELLQPKSVVDIGCGVGAWLNVFQQQGIQDILGIDGNYVPKEQLLIPDTNFQDHDLQEVFRTEKTYDLVVSLEVAEHLPQEKAYQFIEMLTHLGPTILFSAAVPFQPGTNHINCQWPDYWAEIFFERGYIPIDCLRLPFWHHPEVAWWFAQNMILYVHEEHLGNCPNLIEYLPAELSPPLRLVHPELYMIQTSNFMYLAQQMNLRK